MFSSEHKQESARQPAEQEELIRVLHLEDDPDDAALVEGVMQKSGVVAEVVRATSGEEYRAAIAAGGFDLIMSDHGLPSFTGRAALEVAQANCPQVPFIFVSGSRDDADILEGLRAGAADFVPKADLWRLAVTTRRLADSRRFQIFFDKLERQNWGMKRLVMAVQDLSLARTLDEVMAIVRKAARELTGADGATFVLRDGERCFYADEDAIAPLWKGQRFPMAACISGWTMLNRQSAIIEDIYSDPRIPGDAYRPTFVKSLAMVPVRTAMPMAAIGNYWAQRHRATEDEVELLQALANTTAVALENIQLYGELERRVRERTLQLELANQELEAFSYSVSHDLRSPLWHISGFAELLAEEYAATLDDNAQKYLERIRAGTKRMSGLISDLLALSNLSQAELKVADVDLSEVAIQIVTDFRLNYPMRQTDFKCQDNVKALGDPGLLQVAMENLLSNAWKYTSKNEQTLIEFGVSSGANGKTYFIRDNGAGFDMKYATKLFAPFRRLHAPEDFAGHGVGLATVRRIIRRHGGSIWAEAEVGKGATFYFTLGDSVSGQDARAIYV